MDLNDTPLLVVDLDIAEKNCRNMAAALGAYNISWRPHIKTHKSVFFAKKQIEWGARGITCSSVGEAEVMAQAGIDDIYIAYPLIGAAKISRYLSLSEKVAHLSCLVNSIEGAEALSAAFESCGKVANVLIEIDGRMGRGGVPENDLPDFVEALLGMKGLKILGVTSFCGNAGKLAGDRERREDARLEAENLLRAQRILQSFGLDAPITSGGSSVSSRYPDCLQGISESRAGTCIFNDMMHVSMGTCALEDCAAHIRSTVISIPHEGRFVLDAGSKTLSTDTCRHKGYGYISELGEEAVIEALNEEHAMCNSLQPVSIGQILSVIPNHICTAINLRDSIHVLDKGELFELPVDARGVSK